MVAPTGQSELTYGKDERSAFALSAWPLCCLLPFFSPVYLLDAQLLWLYVELEIQQQSGGELLLCQLQICGLVVRAPRSWSSQGNSHKARSWRKVLSCRQDFQALETSNSSYKEGILMLSRNYLAEQSPLRKDFLFVRCEK